MQKEKVALIRCSSYDFDEVKSAIFRGMELLGGVESFVKAGEKILLKPNVLFGDPPARGTTTHPVVLGAVADLMAERGAILTYGDASIIGATAAQMKKAQYLPIAKRFGMKIGDFTGSRQVSVNYPPHKQDVRIANAALDADAIINLCKLKTHPLTRLTGAVKNTFGCLPGIQKSKLHVKTSGIQDFSGFLLALNKYLKPRLNIADGIQAMEGNGPRGGNMVALQALLFSTDAIALDTVMCWLVNLDPQFVPTIAEARRRGLGASRPEEILLLGDALDGLVRKNFKVTRKPAMNSKFSPMMSRIMKLIMEKPVIKKRLCIRCGLCVQTCPVEPKAINWPGKKNNQTPLYTYERCIRCFCCQEVCPAKAIRVKQPLLRLR